MKPRETRSKQASLPVRLAIFAKLNKPSAPL
jgi:hypothetical protein